MIRCGRLTRSPQPSSHADEHRLAARAPAAGRRRRRPRRTAATRRQTASTSHGTSPSTRTGSGVTRSSGRISSPVRRRRRPAARRGAATTSTGASASSRTTATRPAPGAPSRSGGRQAEPVVGGRLERDGDPLPLRPGPGQRPGEDEQRASAGDPRRRSGPRASGDGAPNTSELTGPPSAFWRPVGVGRTRIGQATSTIPPPARKPARPRAHDTRPEQRHDEGARDRPCAHGRRTRVPPAVEGARVGRRRSRRVDGLGVPVSCAEALRARPRPCPSRRRRSRSRRPAAPPGPARSACSRSRPGPVTSAGSSPPGRASRSGRA